MAGEHASVGKYDGAAGADGAERSDRGRVQPRGRQMVPYYRSAYREARMRYYRTEYRMLNHYRKNTAEYHYRYRKILKVPRY